MKALKWIVELIGLILTGKAMLIFIIAEKLEGK